MATTITILEMYAPSVLKASDESGRVDRRIVLQSTRAAVQQASLNKSADPHPNEETFIDVSTGQANLTITGAKDDIFSLVGGGGERYRVTIEKL